ncbi:MAG TPA: hypothetical protein VIG33_14925 [Pseudobdellovibrionaceae bacterium]
MKTIEEQQKEFKQCGDDFADAAFPCTLEFTYEANPHMKYVISSKGLSKREYFAAQIMTGMMTTPDNIGHRKISAHLAVELADELIEALNKEKD